ncbi:MAG: ABC transporter permease [Proteobacteria bacterium]|nr:ABC transporter permease [Pseudomonadota bacterium]
MKGRDPFLLVIILVAAWQVLYAAVGGIALRSPAATLQSAVAMLGDVRFLPHLRETLQAFAEGFAIAVATGLFVGVALGANRFAGEVAEPILVALYSIPKVTLYPVVLLIFGIGMPAKIAFGAIHGIVPISIFAMNAIRNINPVYVRTGRVLRLSPFAAARSILIPAALPEVVTGIRVGFSLTLIGTLIGEMFGSQRGLGHLLMQAMSRHNMDTIMALTLLLVVFAACVNGGLLALDRRLHQRA